MAYANASLSRPVYFLRWSVNFMDFNLKQSWFEPLLDLIWLSEGALPSRWGLVGVLLAFSRGAIALLARGVPSLFWFLLCFSLFLGFCFYSFNNFDTMWYLSCFRMLLGILSILIEDSDTTSFSNSSKKLHFLEKCLFIFWSWLTSKLILPLKFFTREEGLVVLFWMCLRSFVFLRFWTIPSNREWQRGQRLFLSLSRLWSLLLYLEE